MQEPGMVGKGLLTRNKGKKEIHRQWKQGQVSWAEYKDIAKLCRVGLRMAKVCLELNLVRCIMRKREAFAGMSFREGRSKDMLYTHLRERMPSR